MKSMIHTLSLASLAVLAVSCGKKSASTAADGTSTGSVSVASMSDLPDMSTLLQSSKSSLALDGSAEAVTGTPPYVKDIKKSNVETYLLGTISSIITDLNTKLTLAKGGNDATKWAAVMAVVEKFREAQAKCHVIEDAARQISILSESTGSMCYMSRVGAAGSGVLTYVSGEKITDGEFFKPDASADKVRVLEFGGASLGGDDKGGGGNGQDKAIVFKIPKSSSTYGIKLYFCNSKNVNHQMQSIEVDKDKGLMSFSSREKRDTTFTNPENNTSNSFTNAHQISVTSYIKQDTNGKYVFDTSKDRSLVIHDKNAFGTSSFTFAGSISLKDSDITSKMFMSSNFSSSDGANTSGVSDVGKHVIKVNYSGTGMSDVAVSQGAGWIWHKGSSSFGGNKQNFEHEKSVGFEFNKDKSPQYDTVTSSDYVTAVADIAAGKDSDELLKGDAPTAPDTSGLDDTVCSATPDSVYSMSMGAAFMKIQKECEGNRGMGEDNRSVCENLRGYEQLIFKALNQRRGDTGAGGKGN